MRCREIEKKQRKLGCLEIIREGGGSHRKWYNPNRRPLVIVVASDWGTKDLKNGTLRAAIKDLGFDWEEFMTA